MENLIAPGIDIKKNSIAVICEAENCGSETFTEVVFMRKVSKLVTGAPKDSFVPIPTFQCSKCGHINKEFIPKI